MFRRSSITDRAAGSKVCTSREGGGFTTIQSHLTNQPDPITESRSCNLEPIREGRSQTGRQCSVVLNIVAHLSATRAAINLPRGAPSSAPSLAVICAILQPGDDHGLSLKAVH